MMGTERALKLACGADTLIGILSLPASSTAMTGLGVVIVVGGPQYRVGSHRQFVQLARRLADEGHAVLRFDFRGMGDSEGAARGFEDTADDVAAAIDVLMKEVPRLEGAVLWGLCDGASAALLFLHQRRDVRVRGLCLVNPWVRSAQGLARTHLKHYYARRLLDRSFWQKLLRGKVAGEAWAGLLSNLRLARVNSPSGSASNLTYQQRMAQASAAFGGPILLLLSGNDYTAKEFIEFTAANATWAHALGKSALERVDMPGADHTFSTAESQRAVEDLTARWLGHLTHRGQPRPSATGRVDATATTGA